MKNMKRVAKTVGTLGLVGCGVMNSPLTVAADSGWMGGLSVGQSRAKIDNERITNQLLGAGFTSVSIIDDSRDDFAYKIFGGYKFNRFFAVEGGYFNLGQFGYTATTVPAGTLSGSLRLKGLNADVVGMLPVTEKFSVLGRVGVNYAEAIDNFSSTGAVTTPTNPNPSKSGTNYKTGLGVQYDFTSDVGLRGEWERYRFDDAVGNDGDIDMYSLGVVVTFGGNKSAHVSKAAMPSEPEPMPMATPEPEAATEPVRVSVPVRAKTDKYCSILDIQFEINQAEMQREEKENLGVVATFMKKYPNTTAVIEGHSDNVGPTEQNMKLSQQRADSVVSYLVADHKIDPSRLSAVGYGEKRPIADNSTDAGKQMNRRIGAVIACATDVEGLTVAPARVTMALELEFDANDAEIQPEYRDELRRVANFMKANPSVTAVVEGHAGKFIGTGGQKVQVTPKSAMEISEHRARHVVNYLVDKLGIARSRLTAVGFGHTRRVAYGTTLEQQQENRRVNIIFNYPKK